MAREGELLDPMNLDLLAPGVRGYTIETGDGLYVPLINAEKQGNGDVGRYLDSLPRDRRVVVPNVINPRLAGMLDRRGFIATQDWAAEMAEWVDVYERKPPTGPPPTFARDASGVSRREDTTP